MDWHTKGEEQMKQILIPFQAHTSVHQSDTRVTMKVKLRILDD